MDTRALSYFSEEALAQAEAESAGRSRAAIAWMSPATFLHVALQGHDPGKEQRVSELIRSGIRFSSIPYLMITNLGDKTARVDGHAGRHRMRALMALGIERVPVLIKVYSGEHGFRWSIPDEKVRPYWLRPEGGGGKIVPLDTPRATVRETARTPEPPTLKQVVERMESGAYEEYIHGDSRLVYRESPDGIYLSSLRTPSAKRRKGSARRAMAAFLLRADRLGLPVTLGASPLDAKTSRGRLVQFYASLGFRPTGHTINPAGDPEMRRPAVRAQVERNRVALDPRAAWGERLRETLPELVPLMRRRGGVWKGISEREAPWSLGGCWVLAQALAEHFGQGAQLMGVSSPRGECFHVLAQHAGGWWDDHGFHADQAAATWIQRYLGVSLVLHPFKAKQGEISLIPFSYTLVADVRARLAQDPVLAHPPRQGAPLVVEACPCGANEDPAEWLREDHAEIRAYSAGIAKQIKQRDLTGAQRAMQILAAELDVHFQTEEDSVFDRLAMQRHLSPAGRRRLAALRQEHAVFRADIARVLKSPTLAGFAELHRRLETHADAEDALLLP